jgi:hypothetical protein
MEFIKIKEEKMAKKVFPVKVEPDVKDMVQYAAVISNTTTNALAEKLLKDGSQVIIKLYESGRAAGTNKV